MVPGSGEPGSGRPVPRPATPSDLPGIERVIGRAYARYADLLDRPPAPVLHDYQPEVAAGCVWVLGEPIAGVVDRRHQDGYRRIFLVKAVG